jgi:hypothetical protein
MCMCVSIYYGVRMSIFYKLFSGKYILFQTAMYVGIGRKWTSNPVTLKYILYYLVLVVYDNYRWLRSGCLSER